jgi:hypothetical protein
MLGILGTTTLSVVHALISLVGIATGLVAMGGALGARRLDGWTAVFLATTIATSATGYLFPVAGLLPSHIVGAISLVVLAVAVYARYARRLQGGWRSTYVITAMIALYLNVFVLVVQLFGKVASLRALAPTQAEPPFAIAQAAVLLLFIAFGFAAVRKFRPGPR